MWMRLLLAGLLATSATSCSTSGAATDCAAWSPIYVSRADVLTDETARQILAHNLTGRALCGW